MTLSREVHVYSSLKLDDFVYCIVGGVTHKSKQVFKINLYYVDVEWIEVASMWRRQK